MTARLITNLQGQKGSNLFYFAVTLSLLKARKSELSPLVKGGWGLVSFII